MQIEFGHQPPQGNPLVWAPSQLINPHLIVLGDSGSGKTANLRHWSAQLARVGAAGGLHRVHIFDSHGDIDVPASTVVFSQSTPYAYNPLEVDPDPHFGGVRRTIENFLTMIERAAKGSSRTLGARQIAVLRTLMMEVYMRRGFHPDDPSSWIVGPNAGAGRDMPPGRIYLDIPIEENEVAKRAARAEGVSLQFDGDARCWWTNRHVGGLLRWPVMTWGKRAPTVPDIYGAAKQKLKQLFLGTDQRSVAALEQLSKAHRDLMNKVKTTRQRAQEEDAEFLQSERDRAAEKAIEATTNFIQRMATGTEIDDLIRFENSETLKSICMRLENLIASGVCRTVPPPFDERQMIWRYDLRAYSDEAKRIFVENRLERLFQAAVARGQVPGVTDLVVIDEAPKYTEDGSDHIIARIVNEARKFGIGLFLLAQSPTQLPTELLAGVGCKVLLGLDPGYHVRASAQLALKQEHIQRIQPYVLGLVNFKARGELAKWVPLALPNLSGVAATQPERLAA